MGHSLGPESFQRWSWTAPSLDPSCRLPRGDTLLTGKGHSRHLEGLRAHRTPLAGRWGPRKVGRSIHGSEQRLSSNSDRAGEGELYQTVTSAFSALAGGASRHPIQDVTKDTLKAEGCLDQPTCRCPAAALNKGYHEGVAKRYQHLLLPYKGMVLLGRQAHSYLISRQGGGQAQDLISPQGSALRAGARPDMGCWRRGCLLCHTVSNITHMFTHFPYFCSCMYDLARIQHNTQNTKTYKNSPCLKCQNGVWGIL